MPTPYLGTNRYRSFLKAGKVVAAKIAKLDGVVGILGNGAIGRRYGDDHSDLDLLIYAHREHYRRLDRLISHGHIAYRGMEIDIPIINYERALRAKSPGPHWSQVMRWDRQNAQIMHDPQGLLKDLLAEKLIYPDSEQRHMMARYSGLAHEHLVYYPEMWVERGWLYNIAESLGRAVADIVRWIYARHRLFEPYVEKWLFFHLERRAVPEARHLDTLANVYLSRYRTISDAMSVREKLLAVCQDIGLTWEAYSNDEARVLETANWEKLPEASKKVLSW